MSFCANPIAAGEVGALEPLKSFDREAVGGCVCSCAAIQISCLFRLIGSARTAYEELIILTMRAASVSPGFLSGWYFCNSFLYAARITSVDASRLTLGLS